MDRDDEMLLRAYDSARQSNEHHSTARSQYLGFFFTILFAGTAYLGSLAKDGNIRHPWQAATVAAVLWLITLLSILTFIAIAKFGRVMEHQSAVAARIRRHFLTPEQQALFGAEIRVGVEDRYPHALFTVQSAAEATIVLGAVLAIAGQLGLAVWFSSVSSPTGVQIALWALAATSTLGGVVVWLRKGDAIVLGAEIHPDHPKKKR